MKKLHWISNLLLQNKLVRASAPEILNSLATPPKNPWSALCAVRLYPPKKSLSSLLVSVLYQARTFFQNKWCSTCGARGEAKLMCTPRYEFRHGTSSATRHCGSSVSPLPLFRSALASPPRILFCVPLIQFSFFGMVVAGEVGFFLEGETDGIQCVVM